MHTTTHGEIKLRTDVLYIIFYNKKYKNKIIKNSIKKLEDNMKTINEYFSSIGLEMAPEKF